MCVDPVTATMAAAAVVSSAGAVIGGYQEAAQQRYQASIYSANAKAATLQGGVEETQSRKNSALAIGEQTNALASRGVVIDSGTPLLLLGESARNAELDALQIRTDAANKALNFRLQASAAKSAANAAITSGWISAAGQLLGGASKLAELGKLGGPAASAGAASAGSSVGAASGAMAFAGGAHLTMANAATPIARQNVGASPVLTVPDAGPRSSLPGVLAAVGEQATAFAERLQQFHTEDQLNTARLNGQKQIDDLYLSMQRDADPSTAPSRFLDQAQKIGEGLAGGIEDPHARAQFGVEFGHLTESHRVAVAGEALQRETEAAVGNLDNNLNDMAQRAAFAPNAQVRAAIMDTAQRSGDALVATGVLSATAWQSRLERFHARLAEVDARRAIGVNPSAALARLKAGPVPGLDPLDQQQLADMAQGKVEEAAREARAAQRENRVIAREALIEMDSVLANGQAPDPDTIRATQSAVARFGDPSMHAHLDRSLAAATVARLMRGATPSEIDAARSEISARVTAHGGANPREAALLHALDVQSARMRTALDRNPLSWAQSQGVATVKPLLLNGQDAPADIAARIHTVDVVADRYGVRVRDLTEGEESALTARLATASPQQKLQIAQILVQNFGPRATAILAQLAHNKDEHGVFAQAGALMAIANPHGGFGTTNHAAEDAIAGEPLIAARPELRPTPATRRGIARVAEVSRAFALMPQQGARVIATANAIYATRASGRGIDGKVAGSADNGVYDRALQEAAGARFNGDVQWGGVATYNGLAAMVPSRLRADQFEDAVHRLGDADLTRASVYGGAPLHANGEKFTADEMAGVYLLSVADGRYVISTTDPSRGATTPLIDAKTGKAYVLDLLGAVTGGRRQ